MSAAQRTKPIHVLLVDDQRLMREGLRILLEMEPDIAIAGEANNGNKCLTLYAELQPDVVLMDIRMPELDGIEATRRLLARWPTGKIIILTTFQEDELVFDGLRAGARGYLLKDVSGKELAEAIRTVVAGGALIDPSVTRQVMEEFVRLAPAAREAEDVLIEPLTAREEEVLALLSQGLTNREIGARLHLAEGTIKNYVTSLLQKLQADDRTQAALRARELGLT